MSKQKTVISQPENASFKIFGIGNAIMDISNLRDDNYISKYSLVKGSFIFENEPQKGLIEDLQNDKTSKLTQGGAVLNSICICQSFLQNSPYSTFYASCTGDDKLSDQLIEILNNLKIGYRIEKNLEYSTGVCGAVISSSGEKFLCTRIGAAAKYPTQDLQIFDDVLKSCKFVYAASYFICTNFQVLLDLAKKTVAMDENKPYFCFNLSAVGIIKPLWNEISTLLPYIDFLFGSEDEYLELYKVLRESESDSIAFLEEASTENVSPLETVSQYVINIPKIRKSLHRTVIVTRGHLPTLVSIGWRRDQNNIIIPRYSYYPVIAIKKILDLNTAGDAFVGGFLGGATLTWNQDFIKDHLPFSLDYAVYTGQLASYKVIQQHGCHASFSQEEYKLTL